MKNIPKKRIISIIFLLIIGMSLYFYFHGQNRSIILRGEVEGTTYSQTADIPGKIIEMNVQLGSPVKAGELIARLDDTDQRYALEQLQINLEKRLATLNSMRDDIKSLELMWRAGGVARNELDKLRLNESIAEADIREIESRIRQTRDTLNKYEIRANCSGIIISINYNLGSMVNAGYNLADISADDEKYVVCYLPTKYSTQISYGQFLMIKSGKDEYQAEVRFIDVKSQYTPKDMQTSSMKNKVSIKIKLLLPSDTLLKPGNKVEVVFS
ncbi:MAG: efflux RND transporter periplasmic adaptor subunit [Treponema sp.]|jgi:HlyD family secretion protein|nr:efflux RND transporter periplasmic adaptor subunit [Treponema sp.]